jgi:Ca-activated chloride channel family protein
MHDAGPLTDYERRDWLDDLATRLTALLRALTHSGVPGSEFAELQTLVDAIEAGGPLDPVWAEALRVLEAFAEGGKLPG